MTFTRPRWLAKTARERSRVCFFARNSLCCAFFLCAWGSRDAVLGSFAAVFRGVRHGCCHNNHRKCRGDGEGRVGRKMPKVIPSIPGGVSNFGRPGLIMANIFFLPTEAEPRYVAFSLIAWRDWAFSLSVCRFQTGDGEVKYVQEAEELIRPERNTLLVSFTDLEGYNQELATTIQEEYYRWGNHGKAWASRGRNY